MDPLNKRLVTVFLLRQEDKMLNKSMDCHSRQWMPRTRWVVCQHCLFLCHLDECSMGLVQMRVALSRSLVAADGVCSLVHLVFLRMPAVSVRHTGNFALASLSQGNSQRRNGGRRCRCCAACTADDDLSVELDSMTISQGKGRLNGCHRCRRMSEKGAQSLAWMDV